MCVSLDCYHMRLGCLRWYGTLKDLMKMSIQHLFDFLNKMEAWAFLCFDTFLLNHFYAWAFLQHNYCLRCASPVQSSLLWFVKLLIIVMSLDSLGTTVICVGYNDSISAIQWANTCCHLLIMTILDALFVGNAFHTDLVYLCSSCV